MDARPPYEQLHRGRMKYDLVTVKVHPRCESILASFVSAGVARNLNPARSDVRTADFAVKLDRDQQADFVVCKRSVKAKTTRIPIWWMTEQLISNEQVRGAKPALL
jgi:hypothetical protein